MLSPAHLSVKMDDRLAVFDLKRSRGQETRGAAELLGQISGDALGSGPAFGGVKTRHSEDAIEWIFLRVAIGDTHVVERGRFLPVRGDHSPRFPSHLTQPGSSRAPKLTNTLHGCRTGRNAALQIRVLSHNCNDAYVLNCHPDQRSFAKEGTMENVRGCRAMSILCRQQAALHPKLGVTWLARAELWERMVEAEIAAHFRACNTEYVHGDPAAG